jgi:hypothetical protein
MPTRRRGNLEMVLGIPAVTATRTIGVVERGYGCDRSGHPRQFSGRCPRAALEIAFILFLPACFGGFVRANPATLSSRVSLAVFHPMLNFRTCSEFCPTWLEFGSFVTFPGFRETIRRRSPWPFRRSCDPSFTSPRPRTDPRRSVSDCEN